MKLLTIDTKDNCYVIDPNGMNDLQQMLASTYTLIKALMRSKLPVVATVLPKSGTEGEP